AICCRPQATPGSAWWPPGPKAMSSACWARPGPSPRPSASPSAPCPWPTAWTGSRRAPAARWSVGAGRPATPAGASTRPTARAAGDPGIGLVGPRPEGDVERLLGQAWPFPSPFRVTVRTVPLADGLDRVEARARRSLERMGLPRGDAVLVQNAADLAGAEGRAL